MVDCADLDEEVEEMIEESKRKDDRLARMEKNRERLLGKVDTISGATNSQDSLDNMHGAILREFQKIAGAVEALEQLYAVRLPYDDLRADEQSLKAGSLRGDLVTVTGFIEERTLQSNVPTTKRWLFLRRHNDCNAISIAELQQRREAAERQGVELIEIDPPSVHRTLIAVDDPLNLRYRCDCALFKQQEVSAAFPSMTDNIARLKPMHDMFELANLPSIVYGSKFSRAVKELEVLDENSRYLNSTGLALAMDAHKKNCFTYAKVIAGAKGSKFTHSSLFNGDPGHNIDAYFDQALIRCEKIVQSDFEDSPLLLFFHLIVSKP
ncbi:unnamed protein product [Nippostrongylus brasiliensis]|uniref:Thioredoxin_16 domain-containing protein n=1 Tax=Nippostrongylus brasiliensis TaxID=27835 RepID=A0A0N4YRV4_NIPBR|nr:unnamed protein product [Nippostrongylus brasiliensis]